MLFGRSSAAQGHARADWYSEAGGVVGGGELRTAVRLVIDAGWHVYWLNPGEAGLPVTVEWDLPEGWVCGPLEHPMPVRFMTGGLHGFGHVGEVWFPVKVEVPVGFSGNVVLRGKMSWLACNDGACVPGSASLRLEVKAGQVTGGAHAAAVDVSHARVAVQAPDSLEFEVVVSDQALTIEVTSAEDLIGNQPVFVATPEVVDPRADIRFMTREDGRAVARLPLSAYAVKPVQGAEFWVMPIKGDQPWILRWRATQE